MLHTCQICYYGFSCHENLSQPSNLPKSTKQSSGSSRLVNPFECEVRVFQFEMQTMTRITVNIFRETELFGVHQQFDSENLGNKGSVLVFIWCCPWGVWPMTCGTIYLWKNLKADYLVHLHFFYCQQPDLWSNELEMTWKKSEKNERTSVMILMLKRERDYCSMHCSGFQDRPLLAKL